TPGRGPGGAATVADRRQPACSRPWVVILGIGGWDGDSPAGDRGGHRQGWADQTSERRFSLTSTAAPNSASARPSSTKGSRLGAPASGSARVPSASASAPASAAPSVSASASASAPAPASTSVSASASRSASAS